MLARRAIRLAADCLVRVPFGFTVENAPPFDRREALILAPNHASFLDPVFLQIAIPRHVTFLMSRHFYDRPALHWVCRLWNAIPVADDGDGPVAGAFKAMLEVLRGGGVLAVFPEGRISRDGRLLEGQPGIGAILLKARVPVIPVGIIGSYQVLPRHATLPRPGRIRVAFGERMEPPAHEAGDKRERIAAFTSDLMARIDAILRRS